MQREEPLVHTSCAAKQPLPPKGKLQYLVDGYPHGQRVAVRGRYSVTHREFMLIGGAFTVAIMSCGVALLQVSHDPALCRATAPRHIP